MGRSLALVLTILVVVGLVSGCSSVLMEGRGAPPVLSGRSVEELVFYEVNFQTLSGANKFRALAARLDDIAALSVNVLWLMPLHPVGVLKGVGSPYSVKDYRAVNPGLGTLDDLKDLVTQAHARGLAVVLDWVANHTSWDNPWMAHPSWYTRDGAGNVLSPAGFNWTDVADLNYGNAEMRAEMVASLEFWVTNAGIDGFRCDAADFVPDDFWSQAIQAVDARAGRHLIWLAEGGKASEYADGFDLLYGWDFSTALAQVFIGTKAANSLMAVGAAEYAGVPTGKHRLRYTTNHDLAAWENSPVTRYGSLDGSVAAFAVSTLAGGVPLVYGSQEVGFPGTVSFFGPQPIDWSAHPEVRDQYRAILALRTTEPGRRGILVDRSTAQLVAFTREWGGETLFVAANPGGAAAEVTLPNGGSVTVAARGYYAGLVKGGKVLTTTQ